MTSGDTPTTYGVTGSAGFLGSNLVDSLLADGHHVVGLDNLSYGRPENFAHHLHNPRFSFHQADVTDRDATVEILRRCEIMVHLAAHKIPRYGSALKTLEVNVEGTRNVLEAARVRLDQSLPVRVTMASTSDVYGKSPDLPFREEHLRWIRKTLERVVDMGTGTRAWLEAVDVAGKTGTAENPHGVDHAWFVCFAPAAAPRVALAVILENAGHGGAVAAPVAARWLHAYVNWRAATEGPS